MDSLITLVRQHGADTHNPASTHNPAGDSGVAGGMHAMSPFLFTRSNNFFVLFEGAFINSTGGFVGALILSFVFAMIATVASQVIRVHENIALTKGGFIFRVVASLLHGIRQFLHYAAMLIVMTMNVWLIIAVVAGHALGWFVYSIALHNQLSKRMTDSPEGKAANIGCDC